MNSNCTFIQIYDDLFQGEIYAETTATTLIIVYGGNQKAYKKAAKLTTTKKLQNSAMILSLLINYPNTYK